MPDTPELAGPIPFVYDVEGDRIYMGQPGGKHADIDGKWSPGIVEGVYDPKGNLQVRTDTDIPWTVFHLTRLWYSMHPDLEIKGVFRLVGEERFKLASSDIAARCVRVLASDPLWEAAQALAVLGNVYVAGETVEAVVRRLPLSPGDMRIAVQGVESEEVREIVSQYAGPGAMVRVDMIGFETSERHLASVQSGGKQAAMVNIVTAELVDPYHEVEQWIQAPLTLEQVLDPEWTAEDALERTANILDPVQDDLSAHIFEDPSSPAPDVKQDVIDFTRRTIVDAMREAGWPDPDEHDYLSLVLTGSLTTHQYDDTGPSDFDVSLFIDADRMPDWVRADLIAIMVGKVDGTLLPGTEIPLQAYVVPADISREDLYRVGHRAGYDLDKREWVVPPDKSMAKEVRPSQRAYAEMVVDKMKLLLMYSPEAAKQYWHQVHESRREAMKGGASDHVDANVAYKAIANANLFPSIEKLTGGRYASRTASIPTAATPMVKTADWRSVQQKAVRLLRDGNVTVKLNRPTVIMGHVVGDTSDYDVEISRTDPNSSTIEQWQCGCKWSQYSWGRTRQWKKYEGRPCSHVLALYWAAKSHPLDISDEEEGYQAPRGQRVREFTDDEKFDQAGGQLTEEQADLGLDLDKLPRSFGPEDPAPAPITSLPDVRDQITQQPSTQPVGPVAPQPTNPFAAPKKRRKKGPGEGQFKLFDITAPPGGQPLPPTNPTSIPGANPPGWENPGNPTQFPGTYSHVTGVEGPPVCFHCGERATVLMHFSEDSIVPVCDQHETYEARARREAGSPYQYERIKLAAMPMIALQRSEFHLGAGPDIEAWYATARKNNQKAIFQLRNPVTLEVRGGKIPVPDAVPIGESKDGLPMYRTLDLGWHPELQQRVNADSGPNGAPEQRDQFADLQSGRRGEVVDIEPLMKMVRVQIPLNDVGKLHPHFAEGWLPYEDIVPLGQTGDPFRPKR